MKPLIPVKAISLRLPIIRVSPDGHSLEEAFGDVANSLYKAARFNITFTEEDTFGSQREDGNFDGIIGMLQRNESDFAVFSMALELFRGVEEMPVKILRLMGQQDYYIETAPHYNRSEFTVHNDVEDTILIFSPGVIVMYLSLVIGTVVFISSVATFFRKRSRIVTMALVKIDSNRSRRRRKIITFEEPRTISKLELTWKMSRHFIGQGADGHFPYRSQLYAFTTFVFCVGVLLCLFGEQMSSELVNYKKPVQIDTLQDLLDAGDMFKISFTEALSTTGLFEHKSEESVERKILKRSYDQWRSVPKGEENFRLLPADKGIITHWLIVKHRLAFLTSDFPSNIVLGMECSRADDDLDLYSNIYRSKSYFMFENQVQISRIGIDAELESRLIISFNRAQESGLHELQLRKGHEMALSSFDLPFGQPKQLCLNVKSWSDENNEQNDQLKLENCRKFLFHISLSFVLIVLALAAEFLHHYFYRSF